MIKKKYRLKHASACASAGLMLIGGVNAVSAATAVDRTMLPLPEPNHPHSTVLDARDATPPPRFEVKAPEGAPNVIVVLVDDMGFGMPSAFGGPVQMPSAEKLAAQGLRTTSFTPPQSVHQPAPPCSLAATTT